MKKITNRDLLLLALRSLKLAQNHCSMPVLGVIDSIVELNARLAIKQAREAGLNIREAMK